MSELGAIFEITVRSLLLASSAEILCRTVVRRAVWIRRVWAATLVAIAATALITIADLRPRMPTRIVMETARLSSVVVSEEKQPWTDVHYRRASPTASRTVLVAYATGALFVLAGLASSWFAAANLRRASTPGPLAAYEVRVSRRLSAPCSTGVLRPVVLLPAASGSWSEQKLQAVLAHEIAHLRNRDPLWNVAASIACAALWFTPAIWFVRRRLRAASEYASDDAAALVAGGSHSYARILTDIASAALAHRHPLVSGMADAASLEARVQRLLRPGRRPLASANVAALLIIVPASLGVVDWSLVRVPLTASPSARPLLAALHSHDAGARAGALFSLARWRGREREVIPILVRHLGDTAQIRSVPQWSYSLDGWGPARNVFARPSPGEVAAIGLASMSSVAAASLVEQLGSRDPVVRRNAAWALGELRHPRRLSVRDTGRLTAVLDDSDPLVRAAAAWALGDIGVPDAAAPMRTMLARETDPRALEEARAALKAIESGVSLEAFRQRSR